MNSSMHILQLWERGVSLPPVSRALSLLNGYVPNSSAESLMQLSVGERDGYLLSLRQSLFGSYFYSITDCPQCGTSVEFTLDADNLRVPVADAAQASDTFTYADISLCYRRITSGDLLAVSQCKDTDSARRLLVARCVSEIHQGDTALTSEELPDDVVAALAERLANCDSQADISLAMDCPDCEANWSVPFDIASFLWTEIRLRARQLLHDVHTLAWAYGWSEADILAMSDARRQFYLEQVM